LFRQMGTSCQKFIAAAQLEEACRRLADPKVDTSITDIAYVAGFDDLS
jgi:AraC-like DNA-binding protein